MTTPTSEPSEPPPAVAETGESPSIWTTASTVEAIQLALSQSKLFLVWIWPSSEASSSPSWEQVWTDPAVISFLSQHAVAIKVEQGCTDAVMFLQLVQAAPSVSGAWVVFAGRILGSFVEPPSPQEMLLQIQNALSAAQTQTLSPPSESLPPRQTQSQPIPPALTSSRLSEQETHPTSEAPSSQSDTVRDQLAARRSRLEAAKAQHDTEEREARRAAAARQLSTTDPERQKYIAQKAKERAQQRAERAKILQEIEHDKEERRREKARQHQHQHPNEIDAASKLGIPDTEHGDGMTTVAVRFPDSRVLRADFEGEKTLADVRVWIGEKRGDGAPYVLQTTFPTRTFEVSEERSETLQSLFGKGGQVVMKEIKTYSDAYPPNPAGIMSFASSLLDSVTGTISNALGWNTPATPPLGHPGADLPARTPGEAIREARIRNVNYSARERGVASRGSSDADHPEKNWFNGNGLAQEAPPRDDTKRD